LGGILNHMSCYPIELNTEPDHAHILFVLGRTITIADAVANLKRGSTNWLRTKDGALRNFHWQSGYGAFSVSESNGSAVRAYIRNQKQHHRNSSFKNEFRALLRQHRIGFDERYVWD
jgi:REP element-mobilizing transposase RayT